MFEEDDIKPLCVADLLPKHRGFVVPAFQRSFSWRKEHFDRFFEDVLLGLYNPAVSPADVTFIGIIICNKSADGLDPTLRRGKKPSAVLQIVDGQQRLTFLTLLATVIHEYIATYGAECTWLPKTENKKHIGISQQLLNLIYTKIENSSSIVPSLIREQADCWKLAPSDQINSPVACLLDQYYKHAEKNAGKPFKYSQPQRKNIISREHLSFSHHRETLKDLFKSACDDSKDEKHARLQRLLQRTELREHFFDNALNSEMEKEILSSPIKRGVARAVAFGTYLLKNIKVIMVPMHTSLDKTFEVFDSLNTTGCTLSAYESFRPEVFKRNSSNYQTCEDKSWLDDIDEELKEIDIDDLDKHTVDLAIAFAMALTGRKIGRKFNAQREYLKQEYLKGDVKTGTEFLRFLYITNRMLMIYSGRKSIGASDGVRQRLIDVATFCLCYLQKAKSSVALPLFARLLLRIYDRNDSASTELLCRMVLSTTAFLTLWRSSRATTDDIDNIFRKEIIKDLCRAEDQFVIPPFHVLNSTYIDILKNKGGIGNKTDWISKTADTPIDKVKQVARFILLVGTHDTIIEKKNGQVTIEKVAAGAGAQTITASSFNDVAFSSIEHILALSRQKEDMTHKLLNLTLLPVDINSALQDKDWRDKKPYYKLLSSEKIDESDKYLRQLQANLSKSQLDNLSKFLEERCGQYLHMTRYLALLPDEPKFNEEIGQARAHSILGHCWDIIATEWLGWPTKSSDR